MPLEPTTSPAGTAVPAVPAEPHPIPSRDTETASSGNDPFEDAEILQASIKAGSVAQIVVAAIAVIGLVYLLKLVLVTILSSVLLAFVLEPFVSRLARIGIPRAAGALLAVVASYHFWFTSCLRGRIMRTPVPYACFPRSTVWLPTARSAEYQR